MTSIRHIFASKNVHDYALIMHQNKSSIRKTRVGHEN